MFEKCIEKARAIQNFGLRCFIVTETKDAQGILRFYGLNKEAGDRGKDNIRVCAESSWLEI
jgi:hypothetical protein